MANIVEEKVEVVSKEEKLNEALELVERQRLAKKAKFLYKKGLYSKESVDKFDEEKYTDITINTFKGYALLQGAEGELVYVKALAADSETEVYAYEVVSLANVCCDDMQKLMEYKKPLPVLNIVLISVYVLFYVFGLIVFFCTFFDTIANGFTYALTQSYWTAGGFLLIATPLFPILLPKKPHHCKCKK